VPFVLLVLLCSLLLGRLAGGRVGNLATIRLRRTWLVFLAVGVQVALGLVTLAGGPGGVLGRPLLAVSHLAVLGFVAVNWQQPGMPLILLGLALNTAVIVANGAMPVAPEALAALGGADTIDPGKHQLLTDATALPLLADVIPVPVLRSVVSVGDLVLAAGAGRLVVTRMRRPDTHRPQPLRRR
jgi:hypothetical protein